LGAGVSQITRSKFGSGIRGKTKGLNSKQFEWHQDGVKTRRASETPVTLRSPNSHRGRTDESDPVTSNSPDTHPNVVVVWPCSVCPRGGFPPSRNRTRNAGKRPLTFDAVVVANFFLFVSCELYQHAALSARVAESIRFTAARKILRHQFGGRPHQSRLCAR
jgi:hypothetical protein